MIETHTLGEPTRIVAEGFPKYAAKSMMEYKEYLENNYDQYRSAHMCEPRGHKRYGWSTSCRTNFKKSGYRVSFTWMLIDE